MVHWKKNLAVVWLSQFLSIAAFSFAMPFGPYYIQELGVTDPVALKLWVAAFASAAPLSLAIFAPIWGWVADRYGRRLMLLRANLGAAVLMVLMGSADHVLVLVVLRACQGLLTGTMTAAQTLVASHTPEHRTGFAMGALSSAVFSGAMAGVALGGIFADAFGYRNAFFLASVLVLGSAILVLFGTQENFQPTAAVGGGARHRMRRGVATLAPVFYLLGPIAVVSLLRRFDGAYLPLLVQDIHGSIEGAATLLGALGAAACAAGFLAGFVFGHLGDRLSPGHLAQLGALLAGILMIPQTWISNFAVLLLLRAVASFCIAGIEPVFQSVLSRCSPSGDRGFIFGWAGTMRATGWALAPLLSGGVATAFGVRSVFLTGGILLIFFAIMLPRMTRGLVTTDMEDTA